MSKILVIAEKPSVARDLTRALGKFRKEDGWYENDSYIIDSAIGHLVELPMPEDIDKNFKFWRLESLPIIPDIFKLKPIEKTKSKFGELKKLMHRKDVHEVINACDAGREGELIFTYLYELGKCKKPVKRLWLSSMTRTSIREAFSNLRNGEEMQNLQDAARCRSEADWLIGINGTRAITTRMYGSRSRGNVASVGRVQTPTLAIVLEREREINAFQKRPYWKIAGDFEVKEGNYEGLYQKDDFKKSDGAADRPDRIWDRQRAASIIESLENGGIAHVSDIKKRTRQIAPRLYDLTTLQREANNRFGYSARRTLNLAQALYERHKRITYPRTDSRALPEDYTAFCKKSLEAFDGEMGEHAQKVLSQNWVKPNRRIFNNSQVSDHFAIVPTGDNEGQLNADEEKIYNMIARRFIAVFYPPAEYDVTTRRSEIKGYNFKTEGKVLIKKGWLEVYGKNTNSGIDLPSLTVGDGSPPQAHLRTVELKEEETKPPPRYTEATLLSAMEGAGKFVDDEQLADALKEKGLGTPATRASIIEQLVNQKYIEREKRDLIPTAKAENLIDFLSALKADSLTSPSMTGDWEFKLRQIENGKLTRDEFMNGITDMTGKIVGRAKSFQESDAGARETAIISPTDNKPILETLRTFKSQDETLVIYKTIGGRKFNEEEIKTLIEEKQIGPLEGFRSKAGKPYTAQLILNPENKIKFVFDNNDKNGGEPEEPIDLASLTHIGACPKDGGKVLAAPRAFACENTFGDKRSCDFRIFRTMLGKQLPEEEIKNLLQNGKTGLIEKFLSKRTKKYFSAFLTVNKSGRIGFEFLPRDNSKKKKSPAKSKKAKT